MRLRKATSGSFKKGVCHSEEARKKMAAAKKGKKGVETNHWKGDNVGNKALHSWIRKYLIKPKSCEFCREKKKLQLANMTGIYNRDFNNWKYICAKCHVYHDGTVYNLTSMNSSRSKN